MIHGVFKHSYSSLLPVLLAGYSEKNTGRTLLKAAEGNGLEPLNGRSSEGDRVTKEQRAAGLPCKG